MLKVSIKSLLDVFKRDENQHFTLQLGIAVMQGEIGKKKVQLSPAEVDEITETVRTK